MSEFKLDALLNPKIFERTMSRTYDLYLHDEIRGPDDYIEWNQLFRTATAEDVIYIHINSYGGQINTAIQLIRAMRETSATIVTSIEGACMSAATMIFLQGDVCEISSHSQFMVHTYSGAAWGKGNEMASQVLHDSDWISNLMHDIYAHFFSKAEIQAVIDGKDVWLAPDDVFARLKKKTIILEKERKEEKKVAEAPKKKQLKKKAAK
jgi:ATP-dependent protease ClpP protease subunit